MSAPTTLARSNALGSAADYDDYRWLVGRAADSILTDLASSQDDPLRQAARLRRELSSARAHLALEQVGLRRRARAKFAAADRMYFTPRGLEQATDQWIAAYKAGRWRHQPSPAPVWDLCCGIGGDLQALARGGRAVGVDRCRIAALLARRNSQEQADAVVADVARMAADMEAWHLDPDRRPAGRRTTRVELHEPGLPTIERLLRACPAGAIKLAPAAGFPERWRQDAELEWIGRAGECKQLVAWFGPLASVPGLRRATLIAADSSRPVLRTLVGDGLRSAPVAEELGPFLAEPDAAVLAAGLAGELAAQHGLSAIAAGAAYLTGDRHFADPALDFFEINDVLPFDVRRLKRLLRERRIGRLEIKKRGVDIDPERLRRQLLVPGDERATLFLVRRGSAVAAVLTRRI